MWQDPNPPKAQMLKGHEGDSNLESMPSFCDSVFGIVSLESGALVLSANSMERAKRGRDILMSHLGERVGKPRIAHRDPSQALKEHLR